MPKFLFRDFLTNKDDLEGAMALWSSLFDDCAFLGIIEPDREPSADASTAAPEQPDVLGRPAEIFNSQLRGLEGFDQQICRLCC